MTPGRAMSTLSWGLAIGAGIAVASAWYGLATTLALGALIAVIEGFGEALGATFEMYFSREQKDE